MMQRFLQHLGDNLFGFGREETVGETLHFKAFELFTVGTMILWAWDWGFYIQTIKGVVMPLGLANHVDVSLTFDHGVSLLNATVMTLGGLLGFFRILPRVGYGVAALAFNLHYASRYCLGEICHAPHFVGLSMLMLAVAMFFSQDATVRRRFAFGASLFFVGLAYMSAALSKLVATGPGWSHGRHLWLWIGEKTVDYYSKFGVIDINPLQQALLASLPLATAILTFGVVAEAAGFGLWYRKTRFPVALLCIGLHLGIFLSMNILFDMFIYQLLVMCVPWDRMIDRTLRNAEPDSVERFTRLATQFG